MRKSRKSQEEEAKKLYLLAGVNMNIINGGIPALKQFQEYLSDNKTSVFDGTDRAVHTVLFKGNQNSNSTKFIDFSIHIKKSTARRHLMHSVFKQHPDPLTKNIQTVNNVIDTDCFKKHR